MEGLLSGNSRGEEKRSWKPKAIFFSIFLLVVVVTVVIIIVVASGGDDGHDKGDNTATKLVWLLTDIHYDPLYDQRCPADDVFCRNITGSDVCTLNATTSPFGKYGCDAPLQLADAVISEMARIEPSPEFILFLGDAAAHSLHNKTIIAECMSTITGLLSKYFPESQIFPTIGNDDCPANYVIPRDRDWLQTLSGMWRDLMNDESASEKFGDDGFYVVDCPGISGLRLIVLNTIIYSPRFSNSTSVSLREVHDSYGQFTWLRNTLESCRNDGKKAIIMGHIPPGGEPYSNKLQWKGEYTSEYLEVIRSYSDVISSQLFGHLHKDTFHILNKDTVPSAFASIPGISPVYLNNPAARLLHINPSSLKIDDYQQFFSDIVPANRDASLRLKEHYTFSKQYSKTPVDDAVYVDILSLLLSDVQLLSSFLDLREVNYVADRAGYICAMSVAQPSEYESCVANEHSNY